MARRYVISGLAGLVVGAVLLSAGALAAPADKIEICHFTADRVPDAQLWQLLEIRNNEAVDKHVAHSDGFPGQVVPGTDGAYVFDDSCTPVLVDSDGDGVPDGVDNCPGVANADQSDRYGSIKGDACEDDSNGDGILDVNEPQICVHIDGTLIIQNGRASCFSDAPVIGSGSNIAVAHGDFSVARAFLGDNNTATATGEDSTAFAGAGDNNTATATGDFSTAIADFGDNNTATATGDFSWAEAMGDNNTATATGACRAIAIGDNNMTESCTGP